jgi:hypothetical protein
MDLTNFLYCCLLHAKLISGWKSLCGFFKSYFIIKFGAPKTFSPLYEYNMLNLFTYNLIAFNNHVNFVFFLGDIEISYYFKYVVILKNLKYLIILQVVFSITLITVQQTSLTHTNRANG